MGTIFQARLLPNIEFEEMKGFLHRWEIEKKKSHNGEV